MARTYSYSTTADVRILLSKVTSAILSDSNVEFFIERTDDYIDAKLYQLHYVPFTATPPIIKTISCHLAAFYALRTLYVQSRTTDNDAWMTSFKNYAMDLLNDIIKGNIILLDSSGSKITRKSGRGIKSSTIDYDTIFDEGDPTGWQVDTNKNG